MPCTFSACVGYTVTAAVNGFGGSCIGNTISRLYNPGGSSILDAVENNCASDLSIILDYVIQSSDLSGLCGTFTLQQGCSGSSSCSGNTFISVIPPVTLAQFSLTSGSITTPFQVCTTGFSMTVTVQNVAGACTGDQEISVYSDSALSNQVATDDDICNNQNNPACLCSAVQFSSQSINGCSTYYLKEYCYPSGSGYTGYPCGGQFVVSVQ